MRVILRDTKCFIHLRWLRVSYFVQVFPNSTTECNVSSRWTSRNIYRFNVSCSPFLWDSAFSCSLGCPQFSVGFLIWYSCKLHLETWAFGQAWHRNPTFNLKLPTSLGLAKEQYCCRWPGRVQASGCELTSWNCVAGCCPSKPWPLFPQMIKLPDGSLHYYPWGR